MTAEWHYSRDGKKHGPISAPELQALARKGLLSPDDLVWKEGMQGWQKAGRLKGLFTQAAAAKAPVPEKDTPATPVNVTQSVSVLGTTAKVAGELALKQGEKTKIQTLSLPQAYAALGKAVYEQGAQHADTAALFTGISDLIQQMNALKAAVPASSEKVTLSERAINLGKQATAAVSAKSLESKVHQHYAKLGTLTYQRNDLPLHEHATAKEIRKLLEREAELNQEISALGGQMGTQGEQIQQIATAAARKGHSMLLTAATCITFPLAPISWLPIWKHPRWSKSTKFTLAILSCVCTGGLITFTQVKSGAAAKAVASANAEWESGNKEEAIMQYRALLADSMFLKKDEQSRVYRRLIESDAAHDNAEGARHLIEKADRDNVHLTLTEPRAAALLAAYQKEKAEKEEQRKREEAERLAAAESAKADRSGSPAAKEAGRSESTKSFKVKKAILGGSIDLRVMISDEVVVSEPAMREGKLTFKLRWVQNLSGSTLWHYSVYGKEGEKLDTGPLDVNAIKVGETAKVEIYIRNDIRGDAARVDIHR